MDKKRMVVQKASIIQLWEETEAMIAAAKTKIAACDDIPKLMDSALRWINETEKVIQALPDTIEEKSLLLNYLKFARKGHQNNDPVHTIRWFEEIEKIYKDVIKIVLPELKSREGGARGGSVPKRKEWAEHVAAKLNCDYQELNKEQAWLKIPQSHEKPWEFDTLKADYEVFRDGDKLVENGDSITKNTFFKEYFIRKRK